MNAFLNFSNKMHMYLLFLELFQFMKNYLILHKLLKYHCQQLLKLLQLKIYVKWRKQKRNQLMQKWK